MFYKWFTAIKQLAYKHVHNNKNNNDMWSDSSYMQFTVFTKWWPFSFEINEKKKKKHIDQKS